MKVARIPDNEPDRLEALKRYEILDTDAEELFDSISQLAATLCDVPIALVSLIDENRQWFKARVGLEAQETPRDLAFCAHAILDPNEMLIVPDATQDERFRDNPLVTGAPDIRFYAGAPIVTKDQHALGTLCVIDTQARTLTEKQKRALSQLSKQITANLELRLAHKKLAQLNESKNRFFSILSHDLRSPLSSVLSIAQLLADADSNLSPEDEKLFKQHLITNTNTTLKTAENLLKMVQFEEGRFQFQPENIPLLKSLEASASSLTGKSELKKIQVRISCPSELQVWADPAMLNSICQNLLSNALKFSPENSRIQIEVQETGDQVTISFEDQGTGIKPNLLPKLFDLESSYSTPGTAGEQGSGLGLTLCKQFANQLGGDLLIESDYGNGTQAYLSLPKAKDS